MTLENGPNRIGPTSLSLQRSNSLPAWTVTCKPMSGHVVEQVNLVTKRVSKFGARSEMCWRRATALATVAVAVATCSCQIVHGYLNCLATVTSKRVLHPGGPDDTVEHPSQSWVTKTLVRTTGMIVYNCSCFKHTHTHLNGVTTLAFPRAAFSTNIQTSLPYRPLGLSHSLFTPHSRPT